MMPRWLAALLVAMHVTIGVASWGDFDGHIVTRLSRGTPVSVCGPVGCVHGRSWGYGPGAPGRIADLDRELFRLVCGDPRLGLCRVALWRF